MNIRLFLCGLGIWLGATLALRVAGQRFLHPADWRGTLILFAFSFPLMAWLVRRLCRRFQLPPEQWIACALSVALPTMLLDPFCTASFPLGFPSLAPGVAGVFGGWILLCCAGALMGVSIRRPKHS